MDEKSRKSFKAAIWYVISHFISKAFLYVFTPLYTRLLSTSEYGQYSNFLSWQNILITVFTLDLSASIVIAYYDFKDEDEFNSYVSSVTFFSYIIPLFFCTLLLLFREFFSEVTSINNDYIWLFLLYISFNNTLNIFQADQQVRVKYKFSSFLTLIASIFSAFATLLFTFLFKDKLFGILFGGIIINVVISFILSVYIFRRGMKIRLSYLKYALLIAVPLIPHVLAGTILGSSDKVMITRYCGTEYTAIYSLAYTVSLVITMVVSSINKAWVPWFFNRLKMGAIHEIKKVSRIILLIIAFLSLDICLVSPEIMDILGGSPYKTGALVMPTIILSCFVNCISTFYINIEFFNKKTASISLATAITAIVNVLLNYIFIRQFGYVAASYTTLFSSFLSLIFHVYKVKRQRMYNVFDNAFIFWLLFIMVMTCELSILTFHYSITRMVIIIFVLILQGAIVIRYKQQIVSLVRMVIKKQ